MACGDSNNIARPNDANPKKVRPHCIDRLMNRRQIPHSRLLDDRDSPVLRSGTKPCQGFSDQHTGSAPPQRAHTPRWVRQGGMPIVIAALGECADRSALSMMLRPIETVWRREDGASSEQGW